MAINHFFEYLASTSRGEARSKSNQGAWVTSDHSSWFAPVPPGKYSNEKVHKMDQIFRDFVPVKITIVSVNKDSWTVGWWWSITVYFDVYSSMSRVVSGACQYFLHEQGTVVVVVNQKKDTLFSFLLCILSYK